MTDWSKFGMDGGAAPAPAQPDAFTTGTRPDPWAVYGMTTPAAAAAPALDKYQQAAIAERERLLKAGVSPGEGYTDRLLHGATMGWGDEAMAAGLAPAEMIRQQTLDPREGYRYAKAREDLRAANARQNTGLTGDALELVGGLGSLASLPSFGGRVAAAIGGAGRGVMPALARMVGYGTEGAAYGATQGAGNAPTLAETPGAALRGAAFGGAFGAPFGLAAKVAPVTSAVTPSSQELKDLGAAAYRLRDWVGPGYPLDKVVGRIDRAAQNARNTFGRDAPATDAYLTTLGNQGRADIAAAAAGNPPPNQLATRYSGQPNSWLPIASPRDVHSLSKEIFRAASKSEVPNDLAAGSIAAADIRSILTRPQASMLARPTDLPRARAAATLHELGSGNFGAGARGDAIDSIIANAQSAAQTRGTNLEGHLRRGFEAAAHDPELGSLSPTEDATLRTLSQGVTGGNMLRQGAKALGGNVSIPFAMLAGTGWGAGGALGSYAFGGDPYKGALAGLGAVMGGRALNRWGSSLEQRAAERFSEQLRQRSPEYMYRMQTAPMQPGPGLPRWLEAAQAPILGGSTPDTREIRDSLTRTLLGQQDPANAP